MFKTPDQAAFSELFSRLDKKRWKKSTVARAINVTRSTVTMILQGKRSPRDATLENLRTLVERESGDKRDPERDPHLEAGRHERLHEIIDRIQNDPAKYEAAATVLEIVGGVNSKVASAAEGSQAGASAAARNLAPTSPRSRKAGEPNADKPERERGAREHSKDKPATPGQAQA